MPSRSGRSLRRTALAVAALALVALWRQPGSVASVDVLRYPVGLRHSVAADNGQFSVHGIAQGEDQWALVLSEKSSPLAVVQKLGGAPAKYALSYDTDRVSFKPKIAAGLTGSGSRPPARRGTT